MIIAESRTSRNEHGLNSADRRTTVSSQLYLPGVRYRFMEVGMNGKKWGHIAGSSR